MECSCIITFCLSGFISISVSNDLFRTGRQALLPGQFSLLYAALAVAKATNQFFTDVGCE